MRRSLILVAAVAALSCNGGGTVGSGEGTPTPKPTGSGVNPTPTPISDSSLSFAIFGDARPGLPDDTSGYPTAIVTQIFKSIQAETPAVPIAIGTGDYMFADPLTGTASAQLDVFLTAAANYTGKIYYAMGNHECNSEVSLNCGAGTLTGISANMKAFMTQLLTPLGQTNPYYTFNVNATDGSWTAKFVVIAANAWSTDQQTWFQQQMAIPTTYTFVVRHEDVATTSAPGVTPSATIMAQYPYTALLCGHIHTFSWTPASKQILTGNGGAPLDTATDYGYTVVRMQPDGTLIGNNYDYQSHAVLGTFHIDKNGAEVP